MNGSALERVFRAAGGPIIAALAARFRNLTLAEDAFSESCLRALQVWPQRGLPDDPAAWLYRVAQRAALDALRHQRVAGAYIPDPAPPPPGSDEMLMDDSRLIPDERLRLIFICCHPAVAPEARAALTLRLVCGLSVLEIARAFLVQEATLAQRLVRARRKIAEAGVPFELPAPALWPERMEAVLSTLEIAYSRAHEDAAGTGPHAGFAAEMLHLTRLLADLAPASGQAWALAALVAYAEARRPARVDAGGVMVPLSEQDPSLWRHDLITAADGLLVNARQLAPAAPRTLQACLQQTWCARKSLREPAPWPDILAAYDRLLLVRDDVIVRLNRAVALAEIDGPEAALADLRPFSTPALEAFSPWHAVHADLFRRLGRAAEARAAYHRALALDPPPAERLFLERKAAQLPRP